MIKREILAAQETHADKRRAKIAQRFEAKSMKTTARIPQESMTVVISKKGWIRAGKGHEIDPLALNYKSGDQYQTHALGKNTDNAIFFDSNGRSYSLPVHTLPSVRGYGEPLTSKLTPESGASFISAIIENPEDKYFVMSNAGYGFIVNCEDLFTKNKKGKVIVNVPAGGHLLEPQKIDMASIMAELKASQDKAKGKAKSKGKGKSKASAKIKLEDILAQHLLALVSSEGKLLIFSLNEVPILAKGKGKKLFGISSAVFAAGTLQIISAKVLKPKESLTIVCGKKKKTLTPKELKHYLGQPGQKGHKLPRGYQKHIELC